MENFENNLNKYRFLESKAGSLAREIEVAEHLLSISDQNPDLSFEDLRNGFAHLKGLDFETLSERDLEMGMYPSFGNSKEETITLIPEELLNLKKQQEEVLSNLN